MRRSLLISVLVYILFILGLGARNGDLIALAIPGAVYLAAALLYRPASPQLAVVRSLSSDSVSPGVPVLVTLTVKNDGPRLEEIYIRDPKPPGLNLIDGETSVFARLSPGEETVLQYTVSGQRGSYQFGPLRVIVNEHLGLFRRERKVPAFGRLLIVPELTRLRQVSIRPLRTRGYAGPIPARLGGAGTDFFGVREYQLGDPRRWINWRVSARHPRMLFSNEFEMERIADVGLILDARQRSEVLSDDISLFEHAVQATASLADVFIRGGNRVALLIYGRGLERALPGYGKVQREHILRKLAQAQIGDSVVFDSLDNLPTRFFPAQSQIVLVSPLCSDDPPVLVRLRARGYQVLVISPNPITFEVDLLDEQDAEIALATRLAELERTLLLRKLLRVGIQVVDWHVDHPLEQTIYASLGKQSMVWRPTIGVL